MSIDGLEKLSIHIKKHKNIKVIDNDFFYVAQGFEYGFKYC